MSSRTPEQSLRDIWQAIENIESDTKDLDFEAFRTDPKTVRAVERSLQILSEAAIRLGPAAETLCPGPPWPNIRGIGNWLRHQYDRVDVQTVWETVRDDLPPLSSAVLGVIKRLDNNPETSDAG